MKYVSIKVGALILSVALVGGINLGALAGQTSPQGQTSPDASRQKDSHPNQATTKPQIPKSARSEADRARNAGEVLTSIMNIKEEGIPENLMSRAKAIAVIPHVVKGALGFGGRYGKGLVSHRMSDGKWSPPSYIDISGGSFGLQLGVDATDVVLVFVNEDGFEHLLKGKVTLGADAAVAAGPVGRTAAAGTDVTLQSGIYSYSRTKGLFAGISLEGAALTIDDSANEHAYGRKLDAQSILLRPEVAVNDVVRPFVDALQRYSPMGPKTTN
jgi:lipid-binding SYLF domain-containing protein